MFSALSSSSCVATSLASLAVSGVAVDLGARDGAEAGWADALLPDLELRREGRGVSFEAVDDGPEGNTWGPAGRAERAEGRGRGFSRDSPEQVAGKAGSARNSKAL